MTISKILNWQDRLQRLLWDTDVDTLSRPRAVALVAARILYRVVDDFMQGQLTLRAMSLVYTTLLSLVPLLALSFSLLKAFGVHNQIEPLLLKFLSPLGDKGAEMATQIVHFVENIGVGVLGSLGLLMLIYTVVSLIQKVEAAFNFIWNVSSLRSLPQRLSGYLSVVMVGPMLVVTALGITASVMSSVLVRDLISIEPFGSLLFGLSKLVPYLLVIGAFTATYLIIPNTTVRFRSALVGGVVSGVLWETVGWGFASFIVGSAKYTAIYSGFAIVILFLVWLYLNWLVLLLGSSIAFYHQNPGYRNRHGTRVRLGSYDQEAIAIEIMYLVADCFQRGDKHWQPESLSEHFSLPVETINDVLEKLQAQSLLVQSCDEAAYLMPGRDLQAISVKQVLDAVRETGDTSQNINLHPHPVVVDVMQGLDSLAAENLGQKSLKDMLSLQASDMPEQT